MHTNNGVMMTRIGNGPFIVFKTFALYINTYIFQEYIVCTLSFYVSIEEFVGIMLTE